MKRKTKTRKRNYFITGMVLGILLLALIFTVQVFVVGSSKWQEKGRFTIAINSSPSRLVSFSISERKALVLIFPDLLQAVVPSGYGQYSFGRILELSKKEKGNGELYRGAVTNLFGVLVDGYINNKRADKSPLGMDSQNLAGFLLGGTNFETDLSKSDILRAYIFINSLRKDRITIVDLTKSKLLQEESLFDGEKSFLLNETDIDHNFGGDFSDPEIRREAAEIVVLNGTKTAGLAGQFTRILNNAGARIVRLGNTDLSTGSCQVLAAKTYLDSYTAKRISSYFNCGKIISDDNEQEADITVILGEAYALK